MKILLLLLLNALTASAQIIPHISTYLGDGQRNYYGNVAPSQLNVSGKPTSAVARLSSDAGISAPGRAQAGPDNRSSFKRDLRSTSSKELSATT